MQSKLIFPLIAVAISLTAFATVTVAQELRTPLLVIQPPRLVFDTTYCNTMKCAALVFKNDGDTALEVSSIDEIKAPFSGNVSVPFTLLPGQSRSVDFCFFPENAPSVDSQVVSFIADTRVSNSFAFCFDVSGNMMGELQPGMTFFDALDSSGGILIRSFINNQTVRDEGAIYWFKESSAFLSVRTFTNDQNSLIRALPSTGFGNDACIYDGLSKTLNGIVSARNQKIVVLVTASPDGGTSVCGPVSRPAAISLANAMGARVFTIGLGNADPVALGDISASTGGRYYRVDAFQDFVVAFEDIANAISQDVTQSVVLRGRGVAPVFEMSAQTANFYSVEVGARACLPLTVRNTGDAPLNIKSVSSLQLPFSMEGTLPGVIMPGEDATIDLCVEPFERGFAEGQLTLTANTCRETVFALPLRVVGYDTTGEAHGPALVMMPAEIDFDTAYCGVRKCEEVVFMNVGDSTLHVRSVDSLTPPFSGTLTGPFDIQPNQTVSYDLCYLPEDAPRQDLQALRFVADSRVPLSVAMLFDVSASMVNNRTSDGVPFIEAVNNAAADFMSNLLDKPEIRDEAAVFAFDTWENFTILQSFTTDKSLLTGAIPRAATGSASCLFDALEQGIAQLESRAKRKILLAVTDGYETTGCGSAPQQSLIDAARAANVELYLVGIGITHDPVLADLASATGGSFLRTNQSRDAVGVFRNISDTLSTGILFELALRGTGVSSQISIDTTTIAFGEVKVGESACRDILITNEGGAPLVIHQVADQDPQFVIQNPPIAPIMPGTTYTMTVCFVPERLRTQTARYILETNSCGVDPIALVFEGIAWDSVVVKLEGAWTAKPGSPVLIPIIVENRIPDHYDISQYRLVFEYDKTLLFPDPQPVKTAGTMSVVMTSITDSVAFDPVGRLSIALSGGTMTSAAENGVLVKLGFTALLGYEKATMLRLVDIEFENDIPRVGIFSNASFAIDSMCFIDERLIDASGRYATVLKQNAPNPFNPATRIAYRIAEPSIVRIAVYNRLGMEVRTLVARWHEAGAYEITFDATGLAGGVYFYRLITPQTTRTRKMLLLN